MKVRWYFDIVSPYAWLHSVRLQALSIPLELEARPVLFAGLLAHWGQLGPAEVPPKRAFTYRHVQWLAERDGVALRWPPGHPFNPLMLDRLCCLLAPAPAAVHEVFAWVWRDGGDPRDFQGICQLAERLGVTDAPARLRDDAVKADLRAHTAAAISDGVFGVPTLVVDGQVFWGRDGLDMLRVHLADPTVFASAAYAELAALPVLAEREIKKNPA